MKLLAAKAALAIVAAGMFCEGPHGGAQSGAIGAYGSVP